MTYTPNPRMRLGGLTGHIESRRADIERIHNFMIKPNHVAGFYEIQFEGNAKQQEILLEVTFPVWFVDRPAMSFGAELMRELITDGDFPTISVVVVAWTKVHENRPGGGLYTGAQLAVVASGRDGEQMIVHWQANGKAMNVVNPGEGE